MDTQLSRSRLLRWRAAIFAVFFTAGLGFATWAARVPAIKINLGINDFQIGLLLVFSGAFSIIGLSLASVLMARFGARRGMLIALLTFATGLTLVGIGGQLVPMFAIVALGLSLLGLGMGSVDVMMNVEGAAIEQTTTKTLMPLFHAFFSFGTVIGAGTGALMALWGVDIAPNAFGIAAMIVLVALVAIANVPQRDIVGDPVSEDGERRWVERFVRALSAWRDPRIWSIGIVVLGMSFAEGGANDWLSLAVVDGHDGSQSMGALALTVFSISMTVVRVCGGPLVDTLGRVWTLRILSLTAGIGLIVFILAPTIPVALVGVALWGAGASLGFPLGMSAAADDPTKAAASVSAVATIGYIAFLAGPPALGWVAHEIGLLPTLWIIVVLIVLSGLFSGAAKPVAGSKVGAAHSAAPKN
ncbi:MFS family permease [Microbacterium endophyticum]|uniref:MFS family permease n=1 Tax=Microbacterium endophyticum TaxID=1526412 RepID=A0A7W4V484_9MICO|nr:MFS transporter [Microbacterium endophyticum]MBB2976557.1 MFS family permease [Microbacterium endophyticum]NIK36003.1 MFS family permease [Microbacterium endophyticum]